MSKEGLSAIDSIDARGISVAVITATWNADICDQLHEQALAAAERNGARAEGFRVVGALEIPVAVQAAARRFDAVVALGCVIRGGTPHFDYVCDSVTQGLTRIALDESTPVANGILTVNDHDQAVDRAGFAGSAENKGSEAMVAALDTVLKLRAINQTGSADVDYEGAEKGVEY
ncbi:6,7-dimethyl-8-ribityllumazine synthase [Corynebacterium sp. HMSC04H06]|uniref:6,7-dimethyl-8-ribityllumazine synthase n=1 Tax=Corynebacterium sp. HMSC04H06 TaxID=1581050 RepID=UPI0008A5AA61|nr:6,7-dimethyl-8-ribityllumazine synthase [Corynebacterium sp. HMSC04H06]OFS23152.1 6,7-dimethyl-8-ribityllumazine synthase [Corynebacterium sp. HMSC04H06]